MRLEPELIAPVSPPPQADELPAALDHRIQAQMSGYSLGQLLVAATNVEALI